MSFTDAQLIYAASGAVEMLGPSYEDARGQFVELVALYGMSKSDALFCISTGVRLRRIYKSGVRVEEQEHEAVQMLKGFLGALPPSVLGLEWECVVGGLEEGDSTPLYVVPPGRDPIAVPLPAAEAYGTVAPGVETVATYVVSEIEQRVDAAATREGWDAGVRESDDYKSFKQSMVSLELARMRGAIAEASHLEDIARRKFERIKAHEAMRQATTIMPRWFAGYTAAQGYKQLQETNEKKKRSGRYRK